MWQYKRKYWLLFIHFGKIIKSLTKIIRNIQPEMKSWCNPLGSASQKLSRSHKKIAPKLIRATQGVQPSKCRRLHPLGFAKIVHKIFGSTDSTLRQHQVGE